MKRAYQLLAVLVGVCMITAVSATVAFAANTTDAADYTTLQSAVAAVQSGDTIRITKDITVPDGESITIDSAADFTLDLGSSTISGAVYGKTAAEKATAGLIVLSDPDATLRITGTTGKIRNAPALGSTVGYASAVCVSDGTLMVSGGTIEMDSAGGTATSAIYGIYATKGHVQISGGTVCAGAEQGEVVGVSVYRSKYVESDPLTLTLTGGNIIANGAARKAYGVYLNHCGDVIISGSGDPVVITATANGTSAVSGIYDNYVHKAVSIENVNVSVSATAKASVTGIYLGSAQVSDLTHTLRNATVTVSTPGSTANVVNNNTASKGGVLVIESGNYSAQSSKYKRATNATVHGGRFDFDISGNVPSGYESTPNGDGTYTVGPTGSAASKIAVTVNGETTYYDNFTEATDGCDTAGCTITIKKDVTASDNVELSNAVLNVDEGATLTCGGIFDVKAGTNNGTIFVTGNTTLSGYTNNGVITANKNITVETGVTNNGTITGTETSIMTVKDDMGGSAGYAAGSYAWDGSQWVERTESYSCVLIRGGEIVDQYITPNQAISAAQDGDTIKLLKNISGFISCGKSITLDLNDCTITGTGISSSGRAVTVTGGVLTVTDSGANKTGTITTSIESGTTVLVKNNAKLVLQGGCIENAAPKSVVYTPSAIHIGNTPNSGSVNGSVEIAWGTVRSNNFGISIFGTNNAQTAPTLTVSGGTIETTGYSAIVGQGQTTYGETTINITGGTLTSPTTAIYHPQNGELRVSGGIITGNTGIEMRSGTLYVSEQATIITTAQTFSTTANGSGSSVFGAAIAISQHGTNNPVAVYVTGGTIEAQNDGAKAFYETDLMDDEKGNATISISNGTFNGALESENCSEFITGGTYDESLDTTYIAPGYAADGDNNTGVVSPTAALINTAKEVVQNSESGEPLYGVRFIFRYTGEEAAANFGAYLLPLSVFEQSPADFSDAQKLTYDSGTLIGGQTFSVDLIDIPNPTTVVAVPILNNTADVDAVASAEITEGGAQ